MVNDLTSDSSFERDEKHYVLIARFHIFSGPSSGYTATSWHRSTRAGTGLDTLGRAPCTSCAGMVAHNAWSEIVAMGWMPP